MKSRRLKLHAQLQTFLPNAYFQPPTGFKMTYPCIVYTKTGKMRHFADNIVYLSQQEYVITVIEYDPDSEIADNMERHFDSCAISQYYTVDNLNHTTLNLYY